MANRNHYTHKHPWKSIGAVILALLVLFALIVGGLQLWGTGKTKPSNWGKKDPAEEPPATEQDASGGLEIEDPEENDAKIQLTTTVIPKKLYAQYGIMPIAETAMQVKATVSTDSEEPAEDGELEWNLVWKNAQSEWATGKEVSEYVTIQLSDDTLTATLSCLQAFGEQLELTAQIKTNPEVKSAPRTVNYVQRYDTMHITFIQGGPTQGPGMSGAQITWTNPGEQISMPVKSGSYKDFTDSYGKGGTYNCKLSVTLSVDLTQTYTKEATVSDFKLSLAHTQEYIDIITQAGGTFSSSAKQYHATSEALNSRTGNVTDLAVTDFIPVDEAMNWAYFKRLLSENTTTPMIIAKLEADVNGTHHEVVLDQIKISGNFGTFGTSVDIGTGDIDFV